jgi:hypothetical protein
MTLKTGTPQKAPAGRVYGRRTTAKSTEAIAKNANIFRASSNCLANCVGQKPVRQAFHA